MSELAKGVSGAVYRGGRKVFRINSFTVSVTNGVENITDFGSNGVERTFTGVNDFTGTFSGQFPAFDTSTGGNVQSQQAVLIEESGLTSTGGTGALTAPTWKFIQSSKSMIWGAALVTDYSLDNSAEGLVQMSGSWASNGRMTVSSSTST